MATVNAPQRVQSVARAAELLKALGAGGGAEGTVVDLADRCGLNRSTAWRILATLEESGLVERDPRTGRSGSGYALGALAGPARAGPGSPPSRYAPTAPPGPSGPRAPPLLRALPEACNETASLAVPRH